VPPGTVRHRLSLARRAHAQAAGDDDGRMHPVPLHPTDGGVMQEPEPGPGYIVSTHMLSSAASSLQGDADGIASLRDAFNSACYAAENAFGDGFAQRGFNEFFSAWFGALDAQAETLGSVADATQQCAVLYDHAERTVLGDIPAFQPPQPPPAPPSNPQPQSPLDLLLGAKPQIA
jgi:uncharacterized protein YukE